ncbi:hypothetical protein KVT40_002318 [Elsinoe batatas]|uniref:Uncharacterized protein n=1 Tax=Elsinoe batatas TaxID=2601811 RepID=A0A8K0L8Z0_9PEZI|nr:hypothetical protein KVT40_002318 [Elsinoe batatas]
MHASGRSYLSQLRCLAIALPFDYCITAQQSEMYHRIGVDTIASLCRRETQPHCSLPRIFLLRLLLLSSVCTRLFAGIEDMAST